MNDGQRLLVVVAVLFLLGWMLAGGALFLVLACIALVAAILM